MKIIYNFDFKKNNLVVTLNVINEKKKLIQYNFPKCTAGETNLDKDIKIIESIPCFCDIQFNKHEFLHSIKQPNHTFSERVHSIANRIVEMNQNFQSE